MNNLELYEKFRQVPESAKKTITGGKLNGKTDINPMWRIKKLTEIFGPCGVGWYYKPLSQRLEPGANGEVAAFVEIELYVFHAGKWSFGIYGIGGSMFITTEKGKLVTNDEAFKMATTDAISVAAKQLGIGADVYWEADATKYTEAEKPRPAALSDSFVIKPIATNKSVQERSIEAQAEMEGMSKTDKVKYYAAKLGVSNNTLKTIVAKYAPDWNIEGTSDVAFNSIFAEIKDAAR